MKWIAAALLVALAALLPAFAGEFYINLVSQILIAVIFALSLNLLVGFGGMTSLGHASFLGVAAYISALLTSRYGWGHGAAAVISIAGTTAVAACFGVIALRATGLGFLMITLALSQVLWGLAYRMSNVTNGDNGLASLTRPAPFGISIDSPAAFYWFALLVAAFAYLTMAIFVSSSFGSSLKGVRDQPRRMAALGFNPWMIRWITFIYAGFWAGHIRAAVRLLQQIYSPEFALDHELGRSPARRDRRRIGNAGRPCGRRSAGAAAQELCLGLCRTLEHAAGPGVPVHRSGDADRYRSRRDQAGGAAARGIAMTPTSGFALEVIDLKKAFGGLVVTQNISLSMRPGERRLIIGPNGAGKTTLFNQISGDMRPNSGQIRLFGSDVTQLAPYKRAHLGLSRTYQIITLFTGDTLEHNVTLGLLGLRPSRWQMWRPLSHYGDLATEARRVLDSVGLLHLAGHPVSDVAYGEKRRVELAMALAQRPRVLLLDEPLAGLSNTERSQVKSLIASISRETTVIMIEHDMDTALDLAETVTLLNYGRVIVDGDRDAVIADERTREVYLGV